MKDLGNLAEYDPLTVSAAFVQQVLASIAADWFVRDSGVPRGSSGQMSFHRPHRGEIDRRQRFLLARVTPRLPARIPTC